MQEIINILLYILPGFIAAETASLFTPKVLTMKNKEEKLYTILLFSAITYFLGSCLRPTLVKFPPSLDFKPLLFLFAISIPIGVLWGLVSRPLSKLWFGWIKPFGYTGNETVLETVLRNNEAFPINEKRRADLHLKDGTIIHGDIIHRPHDFADKGLYITPFRIYYEKIYVHEYPKEITTEVGSETVKEITKKTVLDFLTSRADESYENYYEGIYVTLDEIKMIKFCRVPSARAAEAPSEPAKPVTSP